jgi:hypothetical protein
LTGLPNLLILLLDNLEGKAIEEGAFDLLEFQRRARETCCPKKLFEMWEDICRRYERKEIGKYQVEEMKEIIWPSLQALAMLRRCVNGLEPVGATTRRKRA